MIRRLILAGAVAAACVGSFAGVLVAASPEPLPACLGAESLGHGELSVAGEFAADPEALQAAKDLASQPGAGVVAAAKEQDVPEVGASRAVLLSSGDGLLKAAPVYLVELKVSDEPYTLGGSGEYDPILVTASCSVVAVDATTGAYLFTFTDAVPIETVK
jgi:hypothetical protein